MVKFVSIFVAHPQSSSLCISLLETRWSVMTGTVRNIIKEKERPKLSSVGFWLFFLVLTECNCYCVGTRPQYDQMIKCNGILWFYLQNEAELFERKAFWYFFFQMKTISVYYFLKHSDIAFEIVVGLLTLYSDTCFQRWSPSFLAPNVTSANSSFTVAVKIASYEHLI